MVIFVLILTMTTQGVMYLNGPPQQVVIVASPEAAAVELWQRRQSSNVWTGWTGELWKLEIRSPAAFGLAVMVAERVEIPSVRFESVPNPLVPGRSE